MTDEHDSGDSSAVIGAASGAAAWSGSLGWPRADDSERNGAVPAQVLGDLHYGNILASQRPGRPWVAIDPAAVAGSPERSVAELLWTRVDELPGPQDITGLLGIVIDSGQLDRAKATAWAFVRAIDYWLWGLENGLTVDPVRCQRIASALAPLAGQRNQP